MSVVLLFGVFFGLVALQVPIVAAMLAAALAVTWVEGAIPLTIIAQRMAPVLDSFPFLAIPLFVLAGNLLNRSGLARRIFDFSTALVGHLRGGLAHVNVLASMIFAGMSGVAQADAAGLGQVEVKEMKRAGYDAAFASAVSAASAVIGPIIPPSVIMVIYAVLTGVSVADLFIAGIIPGVMLGLALMITIVVLARLGRIDVPVQPRASMRTLGRTFLRALPALVAPVGLTAGLLAGVATPTELGALTVAYAILLGFVQRELTLKALFVAAYETVIICGVLVFIVAAAAPLGWLIAIKNIPAGLAETMLAVSRDPMAILAIINVGLLVAGCVLETGAILLIAVPALYPLIVQLGIDPVHFGLVVVFNLLIGTVTPPFGVLLFIMMEIGQVSFGRLVRAIAPFYVSLGAMLLVITYIPALSLWLPRLVRSLG